MHLIIANCCSQLLLEFLFSLLVLLNKTHMANYEIACLNASDKLMFEFLEDLSVQL